MVEEIYVTVKEGNKFLNLSLDPGDLQSKGLRFHAQCIHGVHKDFQRFCKDRNIDSKVKIGDRGIPNDIPRSVPPTVSAITQSIHVLKSVGQERIHVSLQIFLGRSVIHHLHS